MFNIMKKNYRVSQCWTMDMLKTQLASNEQIEVVPVVDGEDFKKYDSFLGKFYKSFPKIKDYHIFSCSALLNQQEQARRKLNRKVLLVTVKECDLEDAKVIRFDAIKKGFESRLDYPKTPKGLEDAINNRKKYIGEQNPEIIEPEGINPYKQVELYRNYSNIVPEKFRALICPEPSDKVKRMVEIEQKARKDLKKMKHDMTTENLRKRKNIDKM